MCVVSNGAHDEGITMNHAMDIVNQARKHDDAPKTSKMSQAQRQLIQAPAALQTEASGEATKAGDLTEQKVACVQQEERAMRPSRAKPRGVACSRPSFRLLGGFLIGDDGVRSRRWVSR